MNVRNKIASFEAHNEEERLRASPPKRSSPLASPVRTSAEKSTSGISTHSAAFTRKSSVSNKLSNGGGTRRSDDQQNSSSSNNNNKDDVNTSTISEDSSVRAPSTTALASQNRIDRLKRSTSNSFAKGGSRSSNSNNHSTTSSATNRNTATTSSTTKDTLLMNRYARSSRLLKTPSMLTGTSATTLRAPQPHDSPLPDPAPRPNQTTTTTQKSSCTTSNTNATHQQQQQRGPRSSSKTTTTVRRQRAMAHHNSKSANLNKVDSIMESSRVSMAQHQDQHQQEDDDDDDELLSLNKQQELMQPELHLLLGDNTTNSDKPLAPRYSNSGSSSTTIPPIRKSRLDKIHKMQNSRRKQNFAVSHSSSINHHQEQQSLSLFSSSSSKSPTHHHHHQQQQQQHVSAITTNDNNTSSSSPPNHRRDPSAQQQQQQHSSPGGSEEAPDDETLTSVRQIMDPPATTLSSSSATTNPFFRMSSPKSSLTTTAEENGVNRPRLWMRPEDDNNNNSTTNNGRGAVMSGNDRNNKNNNRNSNKPSSRLVMAPSSSSEYETDDQGGHSSYGSVMLQEPTKSGISALTPEVGAFFHNHPQHQQHQQQERKLFSQQNAAPAPPAYPRPSSNSYYGRHNSSRSDLPSRAGDDDDDDHMYNDDDDDYSDTSLSYEQRRRRQQEEREREARKKAVAAAKAEINKGPFVQQEDVEHYRKTLETPNFQMAAVVATAATIGCVVLGPVGLVVGLSVGALSVGAMQIPAEQRENMLKSAQESCVTASDTISNTCVNTYKDSGISDHVPVDVENCCTGLEGEHKDSMSVLSKELQEEKKDGDRVVDPMATIGPKAVETSRNPPSPTGLARLRNKKGKVACLREGHIIPVEQIHALNPSEQPRAWLDVLASVNTTHNEKVEAMEEILILAKDKQRARIFVEEGILDSIMWTLGRYFEKQKAADTSTNVSWANKDITKEEEDFAKLAAICCLTLGKAYCAAIHTEGDLQLMSLYERGSVPEERQLAQMLHEVPHHTRITKLEDPTIVDPRKEVFTLHQFPLQQAEEVAAAIKALAESGR